MKNKINVTFFAWAQDPASVPDVDDVFQRQNVMLRLWAGCTDTTKTIKHQTRDPNPITPEERKRTFELHITPRSAECPIYAARSRAAVKFKVERKQRLELCADGP